MIIIIQISLLMNPDALHTIICLIGCSNISISLVTLGYSLFNLTEPDIHIIKFVNSVSQNVFFFSELRRLWIHACRRKDSFNPNTGRICSIHFLPTDYKRDLKNELLGLPTVKRLFENAIPTQVRKGL